MQHGGQISIAAADAAKEGTRQRRIARACGNHRHQEQRAAIAGFDRVPVGNLVRAMTAWATMYGTISFELFGRYTNAVENLDEYYDHQVAAMAKYVGLMR